MKYWGDPIEQSIKGWLRFVIATFINFLILWREIRAGRFELIFWVRSLTLSEAWWGLSEAQVVLNKKSCLAPALGVTELRKYN